jgi:hypothetical protein
MQHPRQLRVQLPVNLPIDPLYMKSMGEYDISLLLWRSWFVYDKGRRAEHGVIKQWKFEPTVGEYQFQVEDLKWSDGSPLTPEHLIANLNRIARSDTSYGKALTAIVDSNSMKVTGPRTFSFKTKNKQPSATIFNQFGSVFFSIVHPADLDETGVRLKRNTLFIGPYKVDKKTGEEIRFIPNPYYPKTNPQAPDEILVRPLSGELSIAEFLQRKSWSNYFQANTLIETDVANQLVSSKFPIWTRGFDRVALMRPLGSGEALQRRREIVRLLGHIMSNEKPLNHPLQIAYARSLQPLGYPLFREVTYPTPAERTPINEVKILSYSVPQIGLIRPWLDALAKKAGTKINWTIVSSEKFLSMDWDNSGCDLVLFSFGVADPEPTTWLSLVIGSKFITYDEAEKAEFNKLLHIADHSQQNEGYRNLLAKIASHGGYLPLFHGATIAVGAPGINFDLVDPLDETVDYSKIKFTSP